MHRTRARKTSATTPTFKISRFSSVLRSYRNYYWLLLTYFTDTTLFGIKENIFFLIQKPRIHFIIYLLTFSQSIDHNGSATTFVISTNNRVIYLLCIHTPRHWIPSPSQTNSDTFCIWGLCNRLAHHVANRLTVVARVVRAILTDMP